MTTSHCLATLRSATRSTEFDSCHGRATFLPCCSHARFSLFHFATLLSLRQLLINPRNVVGILLCSPSTVRWTFSLLEASVIKRCWRACFFRSLRVLRLTALCGTRRISRRIGYSTFDHRDRVDRIGGPGQRQWPGEYWINSSFALLNSDNIAGPGW